jgi:ATP-dependent DNA helicase DinG
MISDDTKKSIQENYSRFLKARDLKPRSGQKMMIAEIALTFAGIKTNDSGQRISEDHVCVIEAGTGTGKTVAYFMAALPMAKALGKHLVVSTATVALQEQIVYKDLPDLQSACELDVTFALAKGRGRYLCLSKLDRILSDTQLPQSRSLGFGDENSEQESIALYKSMMDALSKQEWDGDKDNWSKPMSDDQWRPVTTNHRECSGRRCSFVKQCSFFKSRDKIASVDCIVTNHDLVLSDLALGGGAILPAPENTLYIFDEGHHLPEKALAHFSQYSRLEGTQKWLDECEHGIKAAVHEVGAVGSIHHCLSLLPPVVADCKRQLAMVQPLFLDCIESAENNQRQPNRYRFTHGIVPANICSSAADTTQVFGRLVEVVNQLLDELGESIEVDFGTVPKVDLEVWYVTVGSWLARAEANLALWMNYATNDIADVPDARWVEKIDTTTGIDIAVSSSPILAANTLKEILWDRCCGAVVTSATLTALGTFDRLKMRAGTPEGSHYKIVPSPFNYQNAQLIIPDEASDAGQAQAHTETLIAYLPKIIDDSQGTLILFASRRQMWDVFERMPRNLQDIILKQDDRTKQATIAEHKHRIDGGRGSAIFGLASFAEGVDLPGKYCSHVIVAKLPFSVPDDPIEEALSDWIKDRGGNPFMELSVPDAALKLHQACGRLIRSETDTGKITIMDNRLLTRQYGKAILKSLPPFARKESIKSEM